MTSIVIRCHCGSLSLFQSLTLIVWINLFCFISGIMCDLLWSDPDPSVQSWQTNDRGVSYVFGVDAVNKFLKRFDFDLVVRAHQVVEDGYEFFARRGLVTVFSAPNYAGEFDNAGAFMSVDEDLLCSFHVIKPAKKEEAAKPQKLGAIDLEAVSQASTRENSTNSAAHQGGSNTTSSAASS
jgi:hypothetical protein